LKKEVIYLSLILFFLFIILLNGDNYETTHHAEYLRWPIKILRIIILGISLYLFTKQHIQLFKSLNDKNIYSAKIKKWTSLTILIIAAGILNNVASIFLTGQHYIIRSNSLLIHISACLFLLYRPAFLNRTELSIMLGKSFRKKIEDALTADNFIFEFHTSTYFVNKEASLDELAKKLQVGKNELSAYIYETTKMSFSDLVNKSRVNYFITLIESNKYNDYTIDALSELCGFGTRQSLNRNFKKFHGGNPSDLIRAKS
jgi:AraC-like DNA-binding protein